MKRAGTKTANMMNSPLRSKRVYGKKGSFEAVCRLR